MLIAPQPSDASEKWWSDASSIISKPSDLMHPLIQIFYKPFKLLFHASRSSHHTCSVRKAVLRKFIKFTEKHLWKSVLFDKVAGLSTAALLKKRLPQVFSYEFCEISKNTFFTEHLWANTSIHPIFGRCRQEPFQPNHAWLGTSLEKAFFLAREMSMLTQEDHILN